MSYIDVSRSPKKGFQNGYTVTVLKGLWQTTVTLIRQLLRIEKTETIEYPEQKHQYSERFKGVHYLTKRPSGEVRCTACYMCATNCPAECITIVAAESENKSIEKYPEKFEIDLLRCVFCGYCAEACPLDAIRMGPEPTTKEIAGIELKNYVLDKEDLLNRPSIKKLVGDKQISHVP